MARKKKKKQTTSIFGALMIESLAVALFVFLFVQARAERQQESERSGFPVIQEMFEQTPVQILMST